MTIGTYEAGIRPPILVRHRLRIAREFADLEQGELADAIGVSRNTISNAESGRVSPRRIVINAWAIVCGVPASWLMTGEGTTPPTNGDTALAHAHSQVSRRRATDQPVGEHAQLVCAA